MSKQAAGIRKKGVGEQEAKSIALNQFERFGISPGPEVNRIVDDFAREHAKENKESVKEAATQLALSRFKHETIARMRGEEPGGATTLAMRTVKASPEERMGYEKWAKTEEKAGREPTDSRWNEYAIKGMAKRDFAEKQNEREEYGEWLKGHPEIKPGKDALLAFRAEQRGGKPGEYAPGAPKTEIAQRGMPKRETAGERITRLRKAQKAAVEKAADARQAKTAERKAAAAERAAAAKEKREEAAGKRKAAQKAAEEKRQAKLEERKMKRRKAAEAAKARLEERRAAREAEAKTQEEAARTEKRKELAAKAAAAAVPKVAVPKPRNDMPPAPAPVAIAAAPETKAPKKAEPKPVAKAPEAKKEEPAADARIRALLGMGSMGVEERQISLPRAREVNPKTAVVTAESTYNLALSAGKSIVALERGGLRKDRVEDHVGTLKTFLAQYEKMNAEERKKLDSMVRETSREITTYSSASKIAEDARARL